MDTRHGTATLRTCASARGGLPARLARLLCVAACALSGAAHAQPTGTRHNLALPGTFMGAAAATVGTEICVFCHTPQGTDETAAVPMWNSSLPAPHSFTTYDSLGTSSLEGRAAPVGSVSIACLSCHDGVTSMSAAIHPTGSTRVRVSATAALLQDDASGRLAIQSGIASAGGDLRDDHPVGMQYGGGGLKESAPSAPTRDPDFRPPTSTVINSIRVWWVDTEPAPNGTRQKTDMILYTRGAGSGYAGQDQPEPFIECASCHDPHSASDKFLRVRNVDSSACMACHMK